MANKKNNSTSKYFKLNEQSKDNIKSNHYFPSENTIHAIYERIAKKYPEKIAVKQDNKILTYSQLNDKANAVAIELLRQATPHNDYVGICTEKSLEMIIGLLAILKAGLAYVPLDFSLPASLLQSMLKDTSIRTCLVGRDVDKYIKLNNLEYLDVRQIKSSDQSYFKHTLEEKNSLKAYINFSSGTTGKPKGIICTHKGVIRLLFNQNYITLSKNTTILQLAPVSFDAATFEIWGALLHGGKYILQEKQVVTSSDEIKNAIKNDNVNTMFLTSVLCNTLIDIEAKCFEGLDTLLFGGDIASIKHIKKLYQVNSSINLINCYGPTENTTFSTVYKVPRSIIKSKQRTIPIGIPINRTDVFILKEDMSLTKTGEVGEIWLGGDGLAAGYINNQSLTNKSFLIHTIKGKQMRLYKTGDMGYIDIDNQIRFMGRKDSQVKINGYRADIGQIENCINGHSSIEKCTILIHKNISDDKTMIAYVVGDQSKENDLAEYLKASLPYYLIPKKISWLKTLPLSKTGKIDKKQLEKLLCDEKSKGKPSAKIFKHLSQVEMKLINIWSSILHIKNIRKSDNFFHLGGTSLGTIKLIAKIKEIFNCDIDIVEFYKNPTIGHLKTMLNEGKSTKKPRHININSDIILPLSKNQLRFFKQYNINPSSTRMNIVFQLTVEPLNIDEFIENLFELISRNRVFNCKILNKDDGVFMHYSLNFKPFIEIETRDKLNNSIIDNAEVEETRYTFNLLNETPLRVRAWKSKDKTCVLFNVHHLYFDGSSMFNLKNTIRQLADGKEPLTPASDFIDFCMNHCSDDIDNPDLIAKYINYVDANSIFTLSDFTDKNSSSPADGYQLCIAKNTPPTNQNIGLSKLLLAYQKSIEIMFDKTSFKCQIPISTNTTGTYAGVLGYFINIMIFKNDLYINDSQVKQLESVEKSLQNAKSFLSINLLDIANNNDRYDFSSILFNYIPTNETLHSPEGFFLYEKDFYREMLVFVFENEDHIQLKIVFNKAIFSTEEMKRFSHIFARQIENLLDQNLNISEEKIYA